MGTITAQSIIDKAEATLFDDTNVRWSVPELLASLNDGQRQDSVDGATPGRAITPASMETLDRVRPNWHTDTASVDARHYLFDPRDPKTFYVTPPQPTPAGKIEAVYAATPADVAAASNPITIDDIYATALYYFILARAHSKETPGADTGKAAGYYNLFLGVLGLKAKAEDRSFARSPRPQQAAQVE